MFKSVCLASALALSALALAGLTPAAAAVHVESCMEKEKECKTATVGTTYETVSKEFLLGEKGSRDKCELTTTHEVKDATSENSKDPLEVTTTKATFSNCSGEEGTLKATGLPWKLTTNTAEWEASHTVELMGYGFTGFFCEWVLNAPNDLVRENLDTRVVTGNMLGQGSVACALLLIPVNHALAMVSVNDPKLTGAKDVVVK